MDLEFLGIETKTETDSKIIRTDEKVKTDTKAMKFKLKHQQVIKNVKNIFEIPENDGEMINILSNNQFDAFTFIPFILSKKKIKNLYVTTYSITPAIIRSLADLVFNKEIETLTLFISGHILKRRESTARMLIDLHDKYENIKVGFSHSHAKITIMDNYVITGSGNMNRNARIEQYILAKSEEMANFFKETFFKEFELTEKMRGDLGV